MIQCLVLGQGDEQTQEKEERFILFEEANKILAEEMPVIPLFYPQAVNLIHPEVKNWVQSPIAHVHYKHVSLQQE